MPKWLKKLPWVCENYPEMLACEIILMYMYILVCDIIKVCIMVVQKWLHVCCAQYCERLQEQRTATLVQMRELPTLVQMRELP